ncbi:type II secretion system protein GspM [Vibrio sp. CK2-1]|uniref:type II secretion system protein GspM n=1 Tax=Vibrio sp. CK2-1 TaxID=2912249 RepID=UPI001EFFA860|nr:type II secretion system protein GspM [Vibrio sp. CK2-1]MCF7353819.1 type II secretion system protein GspM [Vibrio sp. CK2-1]
MEQIKQQWALLSAKFDKMSEREKWLTTVAGWVAILFLLYTFMVEPAQVDNNAKTVRLASLKGQIGQLQGDIEVIKHKLKQDPDKDVDKEYSVLLTESQDLSLRLSNVVDSLVTPTGMAELLEQVLEKTHKLKLVALTSLPSEPITREDSDEDIGYYIHPVKIELTGNYFDILEYLAELEQMKVKYYWRSFNYQVIEYPQAQLQLVVYTLGAKEEFIGG